MNPLRRSLLCSAGLFGAAALQRGHAAVGGLPSAAHSDSSPEWEHLRAQLFPGRDIDAALSSTRVQVILPLRAAYGASVPVKIVAKLPQTAQLYLKKIHVVVDKNPSPLAAVLELTPALGQADFETRLRVDEYSHVRAVSEWSDGQLSMDSRYVKTSGGCSAPPNRGPLHLIGRTVLTLPEGIRIGRPTPAQVTVVHPNDTGFELNQQTVMYIPSHFVRHIRLSYGEQLLFDAELDFSVSENPSLRFDFVPRAGGGELRAEVEDSKDRRFVGTLAVEAS
ncbi:MAG: quinoprotein dehydrogenase-associated SoxYZ-like carrier [Rubrivivax sp.]